MKYPRSLIPKKKTELLELSQGKPKAEVQKITVKYQVPSAPLKKEKVVAKRILVENKDPLFSTADGAESREETRFTFTVEVNEEFMQLLKESKDIVGVVPSVEVLKRTLKEFVNKRKTTPRTIKPVDPANRKIEINPPCVAATATKILKLKPQSRYIRKSVAHRARARDQHQCTFISSTGRRCSERCGLELDHIEPFALGGTNDAANLRLLCPAHNQLQAEAIFGREKVESYFRR